MSDLTTVKLQSNIHNIYIFVTVAFHLTWDCSGVKLCVLLFSRTCIYCPREPYNCSVVRQIQVRPLSFHVVVVGLQYIVKSTGRHISSEDTGDVRISVSFSQSPAWCVFSLVSFLPSSLSLSLRLATPTPATLFLCHPYHLHTPCTRHCICYVHVCACSSVFVCGQVWTACLWTAGAIGQLDRLGVTRWRGNMVE